MARQRWGFIHIAALALMGVLTACGGGKSSGSEGGSQAVVTPTVTSVSPNSAVVGSPLNLILTGTHLAGSGGITVQFSGCPLALQSGGTDTRQTYQCTPTQVGSFSVTINSATGTVLSSVTVNVAAAGGFTKIAADGTYLPDTATTWSCVRHNATGLLWEAHVTRQTPAHPCSFDPTLTCTGYTNFGDGRVYDASAVTGSVCGKPGRLPTVDEGTALVNDPAYAMDNPTPGAFMTTWFGADDLAWRGWSSSPASLPGLSWFVFFGFGSVTNYVLSSSYDVRLVAGP